MTIPTKPFGTQEDLKHLRLQMRKKRAELNTRARRRKDTSITKLILKGSAFVSSKHIAAYISDRGEVSLQETINKALLSNKKVFLPVLDPIDKTRMHFIEYRVGTQLKKNRFGMLEPDFRSGRKINARFLGLVLCPLVAFDAQCHRVGMGGGFYDRHFAFKNKQPLPGTPKLIGLAYELQKVEGIAPQPWDVPMHSVITERNIYLPRKNC